LIATNECLAKGTRTDEEFRPTVGILDGRERPPIAQNLEKVEKQAGTNVPRRVVTNRTQTRGDYERWREIN